MFIRQFRRSIFGISGDGYRQEWILFGITLFRRQTVQKWTPIYHEVRTEHGLRFGPVQISIGLARKVWRDGKSPRVEWHREPN